VSDCVTAEDILRQNPQIDRDQLEEMRETLRRLREQGARRKDYDLVPPFGGRRVTVLDDARAEPRPTRAKRPHVPK
jgi:hypothetical protein